jgi:hypothetical protein
LTCLVSSVTPGAELGGKQRLLEAADAVFAGDRAAERDGQFGDLRERERVAFLRRFVGRVEDDGRVRVAVPGVRDDRDRDLPGRGNRLDPAGSAGS